MQWETLRRSKKWLRLKGALFEIVVESFLRQSGYRRIQPDGTHIRKAELRGRGTWHQIDAFGGYKFGIPFLHEIRLISEAKCYSKKARLWVVRNFAGALKDISENYFVERHVTDPETDLVTRYTDAGAVFSAKGFTLAAEDYAYAQGIFLISYENNPILGPVLKSMYKLIDRLDIDRAAHDIGLFKEWIRSKMDLDHDYLSADISFAKTNFDESFKDFNNRKMKIRTSYIATATNMYPVHLLSLQQFPWDLFKERDDTPCQIHFDAKRNYLTIVPTEDQTVTFHVSIPAEVFARYKDDMTVFKERFFQYVDIPAIQENGIRRTLQLRLDMEWLAALRSQRLSQEMAIRGA